ncbi:carotenoid isomerooxygenase-like [Macrosteles quadrilineatus]|uniref:carotenoid isomerooxygenase-like n=1 Tax=Macrosteles quadrilineatus TaxID=74068 RepID=UPI0023E140AC|nr:carotenoid isomerooxygenase-like [Macrosteles quadrilineatus]
MSNLCRVFSVDILCNISSFTSCLRYKSICRPMDVSLPQGIRHALDTAGEEDSQEVARKLREGEPLYPNNDTSILWRSCHQEVLEPLAGVTTGNIPEWLNGTLLRNGPGLSQIGEDKYQHWFDGPAMVQRFGIADGKATYQCRFLQTNTYRKNMAAGRIVCNEFGTGVAPDPCQTIFHRIMAMFNPGDNFSDNAMISVYPFGDHLYCYTESPVIHRVDPNSLETLDRVDLAKHLPIMSHTSHPHVTQDGSVYNQVMKMAALGPSYSIVKFPASPGKGSKEMFEAAEVVASVKARWPLHPSYMHTFGLTDNFYVIVEQPLTMSVPSMVKTQIKGDEKLTACFKFFPDEQVRESRIVKNRTSKGSKEMFEAAEVVASVKARWPLHPSYMHTFGLTDNFYVIVEQPLTMSVPSMVKTQIKGDEKLTACFKFFPDEQTLFHVVDRSTGHNVQTFSCEPFFFFHIINQFEQDGHLVIDICCYSDGDMIDALYRDAMENMNQNPDYARLFRGRPLRFVLPLAPLVADKTNLVKLKGSSAAAWWEKGTITVKPELLCAIGCEMPRINYDRHLGRPYRYFYGISSDVDADNPGSLVKVDTDRRTAETWKERGVFPSEPVFVSSPDAKNEDDGVLIYSLLWGEGKENQVGLVVLDAATMKEMGRTVFTTPSAVPKDLHGWFTPNI